MNTTALTGKLVRLTMFDPEKDSEINVKWDHNPRFQLLANGNVPRIFSTAKIKDWSEKSLDDPNNFFFMIRTLEGDRPIGGIGLDGINWVSGEAWVGIGIGEEAEWGKGYGTDAMAVILRFAFQELNLHRVSLDVFQFNERAVRSYEKLGFRHEGAARQWMLRDGARYDLIFMGILSREWEAMQAAEKEKTAIPGG